MCFHTDRLQLVPVALDFSEGGKRTHERFEERACVFKEEGAAWNGGRGVQDVYGCREMNEHLQKK